MIVKMSASLSKGFAAWKEMVQNDAELTQARIDAGANVESAVATPISGDSFSNFPD
jgi:hypothetical protein